MASRTESLWRATHQVGGFAPLDRNLDVDVAIVGGGISGLTAALILVARRQTGGGARARHDRQRRDRKHDEPSDRSGRWPLPDAHPRLRRERRAPRRAVKPRRHRLDRSARERSRHRLRLPAGPRVPLHRAREGHAVAGGRARRGAPGGMRRRMDRRHPAPVRDTWRRAVGQPGAAARHRLPRRAAEGGDLPGSAAVREHARRRRPRRRAVPGRDRSRHRARRRRLRRRECSREQPRVAPHQDRRLPVVRDRRGRAVGTSARPLLGHGRSLSLHAHARDRRTDLSDRRRRGSSNRQEDRHRANATSGSSPTRRSDSGC